ALLVADIVFDRHSIELGAVPPGARRVEQVVPALSRHEQARQRTVDRLRRGLSPGSGLRFPGCDPVGFSLDGLAAAAQPGRPFRRPAVDQKAEMFGDLRQRVAVGRMQPFGTAIDWETGIVNALRRLFGNELVGRSRDDILAAFARHETAQEAETPEMIYSELLTLVHRLLAKEWGIAATAADHRAFGGSVGNWPAFHDSAAALAYLKQFYKLVILSNVDRASFAQSQKRLGVTFDMVYTAEDIGS